MSDPLIQATGLQKSYGSGAARVEVLKGIDLTVQADRKGQTAQLSVKPLAANCKAVVVHLPDGSTKRLPPLQGGTLDFPAAASARILDL